MLALLFPSRQRNSSSKSRRASVGYRPSLDVLEDRCLMAGGLAAPDANDTFAEAINLGSVERMASANGSISEATDVNMYKMYLRAGQASFDIDTPTNGSPGLGSYIRLFNDGGTQLAANNDARAPDEAYVGFDSYLGVQINQEGWYYLGVSNWLNTEYDPISGEGDYAGSWYLTGPYQLEVRSEHDEPSVQLTVAHSLVTLMETQAFRVELSSALAADSCKIQVRREGSLRWTTVQRGSTADIVQRLAGHFVARAVATTKEGPMLSDEQSFEVQFPSYADIVANQRMLSEMKVAWGNTVRFAEENCGPGTPSIGYLFSKRREYGFWIVLDTATGMYHAKAYFKGKVANYREGGDALLSPKPGDREVKGKSAKYVVGLFHTHTPTTFTDLTRTAGPSPEDVTTVGFHGVVGIVYDYTYAGMMGRGYPLDAQASHYWVTGLDRRPTP